MDTHFATQFPAQNIPPAHNATQFPAQNSTAPYSPAMQTQGHLGQAAGIVVDISPEGWAAYARGEAQDDKLGSAAAANPTECQTCKSRTYMDVSDDPSVSFQTPTHISPGQSAAAVASHEMEHVTNEQAKAEKEGREIVSQSVTLQTSICPECKRVYVSGGVTRTVSAQKQEVPKPESGAEA